MKKQLPDLIILNESFYINNSELYWKIHPKHTKVNINDKIESINDGYLSVTLNKQKYFVHRIMWKMYTGNEPIGIINHKDGNKLNNSFENLEDVNNSINQRNKCKQKNNISGHANISINNVVRIVSPDGIRIRQVCHSLEDAIKFRDAKFNEWNFGINHGK
jgi:hypothetical protein